MYLALSLSVNLVSSNTMEPDADLFLTIPIRNCIRKNICCIDESFINIPLNCQTVKERTKKNS